MESGAPGEWMEQQVAALRERLIFLVESIAPNRSRYEYLESKTGVSAARWQNLFLRRVYPQTEMILAVTQLRPQYIEWLIAGELDLGSGASSQQSAPSEGDWQEYMDRQAFKKKR